MPLISLYNMISMVPINVGFVQSSFGDLTSGRLLRHPYQLQPKSHQSEQLVFCLFNLFFDRYNFLLPQKNSQALKFIYTGVVCCKNHSKDALQMYSGFTRLVYFGQCDTNGINLIGVTLSKVANASTATASFAVNFPNVNNAS